MLAVRAKCESAGISTDRHSYRDADVGVGTGTQMQAQGHGCGQIGNMNTRTK